MSSNNNQNKKPKVNDTDEQQWDAVRRYLEQGPFASDHPGVRAALEGIDRAQAQQRRDRKLHAKFAASAAQQQPTTNSGMTMADEGDAEDAVKVELPSPENRNRDAATQMEEEEDDWHNVVASHSHEDTNTNNKDNAGSVLAQQAVAQLAQHGVQCATPVAALAVVLHAALLQCGFTCTGVPPSTDSANNGFAAPVRDLKEFLPAAWEDDTKLVRLRYRQPDTGALVLTVAAAEDPKEDSNNHTTVRVTLAASSTKTKSTRGGTKRAGPEPGGSREFGFVAARHLQQQKGRPGPPLQGPGDPPDAICAAL